MLSKKNILIHALSLVVLCIGFVLLRFVFLELHGMKSWPELLFGVGLLVLAISFFCKGKISPICAALGYSIGFGAGFIFQIDSFDPGGGTTNNLWLIWTAVFAGLIFIGIIADLIAASKRK